MAREGGVASRNSKAMNTSLSNIIPPSKRKLFSAGRMYNGIRMAKILRAIFLEKTSISICLYIVISQNE